MTADASPGPPAPGTYDTPEGYATLTEPKRQAKFVVPRTTKDRVNGAVRYASDTGQVPGVESQTDLLRIALHRSVTELENRHNDGKPFPPPASNGRGRGPDRAGEYAQISGSLPVSLGQRVAGAVDYLSRASSGSEISSINLFTDAAVCSFLADLEARHNGGKHFKPPRGQLPRGRRPR